MKLALYRGDADKIKEFQFSKTNKYCLLGQGIYLSDSLKIANSYRTKGTNDVASVQLFYGQAAHRNDAIEQSFAKFCECVYYDEHGWRRRYDNMTPSDKKKHEARCQVMFKQFLEEKTITANYTTAPVNTVIRGRFTNPSSTIAAQKELDKNHKRYLKVVWEKIPNAGFISKFEFNEQQFNTAVFNVDKACNDDFFWTLMYESGVGIGKEASSLDEYVQMNKGSLVYNAVTRDGKNKWKRIAQVLEPYGFVGFEYSGGMRLGGGFSHRAFCIWDEDFVNRHKVDRFK